MTEQLVMHGLINRIFEAGRQSNRADIYCSSMRLFLSSSSDTVDMLLEELEQRKQNDKITYQDGMAVFEIVYVICEHATQTHASRMASLCVWDEIAWTEDGSIRSCLLDALKKIGGPNQIPVLQEFAEKVKGVEYGLEDDSPPAYKMYGVTYPRVKPSRLYALQQQEIQNAINAIISRNG